MTLVGKKFPNMAVDAMNSKGTTFKLNLLEEAVNNKKKVLLFWYPKDFTFVCPTELLAFQKSLKAFEDRNTLVVGASCDTPEVHFAWLSTSKDQGGIEGVTYPLLADSNRNLSSFLDILDITNETFNEEIDSYIVEGDNVTFRATFLIDESGTVFHQGVNHMPLGRNVEEYLRLIDAYSHVQEHGEVCPANWKKGDDTMEANRTGVLDYLSKH